MIIRRTFFFLLAVFVGLLLPSWVMTGCSRSGEPSSATPAGSEAAAPAAPKAPDFKPGQTTCPVMENPVDKTISTLYQGKKVYFCCKPCIAKFNEAPEKYVPKLK